MNPEFSNSNLRKDAMNNIPDNLSPIVRLACVLVRCNPDLKAFYRRLRDEKAKPAKQALTAVARKLVTLANTLVHDDRLWVEKRA